MDANQTKIEKKFSEEITDYCVSVKITSGLPQLSTSIGEVAERVREDFDMEDDDEFGFNFSKGLMPKAMLTRLKRFPAELRSWVKHNGFPRIEDGRGIDYLLMVDQISEAYAKEDEIKQQMRDYVDHMIKDWDSYRQRVLDALGSVKNPERYFSYRTKEEYLGEFHLKMHINLVSNATMIPAEIVDEEVRRRIQESVDYEAGFLLTRLEECLDTELKILHNRLLNTESSVNKNTFNQINNTLEKVEKFSLGHSDSITRAVNGTRKIVAYLSAHPEKIAELGTRKSCEATFNKIYAVLSAEEMHVVAEYPEPIHEGEGEEQVETSGGDQQEEGEEEATETYAESDDYGHQREDGYKEGEQDE